MVTEQTPLRPSLVSLAAALVLSAAPVAAAARPFEVFAASAAVRVFEDGYGRPAKQAAEEAGRE